MINNNLAPITTNESEKEVLNSFITNPESLDEYIGILKPIHFYNSSHQLICQKIYEYYKNNKRIDQIVIVEDLKSEVSFKVFEDIFNCFGHAISTHVENIIKSYKAREFKKLMNNISNKITKDNTEKLIEEVENKCLEINNSVEVSSYESLEDIFINVYDGIQESYIKGSGQGYINGIKTGFHKLDNALGGLKKKSYYVLAARPSMGKSAFSLSLVERISEEQKILYIQLDMTKESMAKRLLSMKTGISNRYLSRGKLTEREWDVLGSKGTPRKNLFISDKTGTTVNDIRRIARRLKFRNGLDILIIDHIGKIKSSVKGTVYEQMTKISNELKEIARELDVVLICLSQLSRAVEQRADKRPMLSDLRDSGRIEEDADAILMLYRDGYYKAREDREQVLNDELELSIQKNRDGLTGTIVFDYNLENQRIKERII